MNDVSQLGCSRRRSRRAAAAGPHPSPLSPPVLVALSTGGRRADGRDGRRGWGAAAGLAPPGMEGWSHAWPGGQCGQHQQGAVGVAELPTYHAVLAVAGGGNAGSVVFHGTVTAAKGGDWQGLGWGGPAPARGRAQRQGRYPPGTAGPEWPWPTPPPCRYCLHDAKGPSARGSPPRKEQTRAWQGRMGGQVGDQRPRGSPFCCYELAPSPSRAPGMRIEGKVSRLGLPVRPRRRPVAAGAPACTRAGSPRGPGMAARRRGWSPSMGEGTGGAGAAAAARAERR